MQAGSCTWDSKHWFKFKDWENVFDGVRPGFWSKMFSSKQALPWWERPTTVSCSQVREFLFYKHRTKISDLFKCQPSTEPCDLVAERLKARLIESLRSRYVLRHGFGLGSQAR